jgi:hypothetical protein
MQHTAFTILSGRKKAIKRKFVDCSPSSKDQKYGEVK